MHQTQMTLPHPSAIHPASMHVSAGLPAGHHFLPSPALASPVGSAGNSHPPNPPLAANAPCSTLFVANLGQFVSEHELKEVFSSMPGFCRLRMHNKGHTPPGSNPVAFIEFKDASSAGAAMSVLQGKYLLSSDRGSIRIEYAKSKMINEHNLCMTPPALSALQPLSALTHHNHLYHHHHHHHQNHHARERSGHGITTGSSE